MSRLALYLLGTPYVMQADEEVKGFRSIKARALLFYIAVSGQPESRTKLAGLLWSDLPEDNANANLRKTLTNLRKMAGPHLAITRESVAVDQTNPPWLDVQKFEAALDSGDPIELETAVDLYRGDFLDGFYVRDSPEFETWLLTKRYQLRERLLAAIKRLAEYEASQENFRTATNHARRLLALEPLREDIHRLLMILFARSGQRAQALTQYEVCVDILAQELEVEPGEETVALFRKIRDGTFVPPLPAPEEIVSPRHNLPASLTSFVGRDAELAQIKKWLAEDHGRLLTIVGPGGIGKTRLALYAARSVLDKFTHGAWLISLTSLTDVENLPTVMASRLGITFIGNADPKTQVVNYLRRRELLLVLDNVEHLVSQSLADFLISLLSQASGVKVVITSRQRLMMQAEQVLNLSGLAYPEMEMVSAASAYPAGKLFLERCQSHGIRLAKMLQVDEHIQHLCRQVDGLPLALELAAAWTRMLPLSKIIHEIERGIEFPASTIRDLPSRHRSIRAVFNTSWKLLDNEEQRLMRQLAYFRGGFSDDSAAEIVSATSAQLRTLANKSLIRQLEGNRYDMHELIRQYAAGKLALHEAEEKEVAKKHGRYFSQFLENRIETIQGSDYLQAKAEIEADIDNVRQAWEWAMATHNLEDIARSAETLHYYFFNTQGLFSEAAQRFQHAAAQIEDQAEEQAHPLAGRLLLMAAVNQRILGQLIEARQLAQKGLEIFYQHELSDDIARATSTLSVIQLQLGDKEPALRLAEKAVTLARDGEDPVNLCLCLNNLAYVLAHNGDYNSAIAIAEESADLARKAAYPHGLLSAMNMLGVYYQEAGENKKAETVFEELLDKCRESATKSRLAQVVNNLGSLYKKRGEWKRALPLLEEALTLYEEVGQTHYAAFVRVILGEVALSQGKLRQAQGYCAQAMSTAQEIDMPALALNALVLQAHLLSARGENEQAVSLLMFVTQHSATLDNDRKAAQEALQTFRESMSPQSFAVAENKGKDRTLADVIQEVWGVLSGSD